VNEDEDLGERRVLVQGCDDGGIVDEVGIELARFYIEDEYEDCDGRKDM